jgi:L-seryl-tRNA(Ser) seleniumtransferase
MLSAPASEIESRSRRFIDQLETLDGLDLTVMKGFSKVGGGAAPEEEIPTYLIAVDASGQSAQRVLDRLRSHRPPVIARISDDRVLLDLRTVLPEQEGLLQSALKKL